MRYHYTLFTALIALMISCTSDRDITETTVITDPQAVLVHYWNFNALPSGTVTEALPDMSLIPGEASIAYEGNGEGYMDDFAPGYSTNAQNSDADGSGLRARNPSDTRAIIVSLPTTGFKKSIIKFATARSGSGAVTQNYSYTIDGINYITTGLEKTSHNAPEDPVNDLVTLDFSAIIATDNNPDFKLRIAFSGDNASGITGNNRFDNFTLQAIPMANGAAPTDLSYAQNNAFTINSAIMPIVPAITGSVISYSITPALPEGLSIDPSTGIISGTPTVLSAPTSYTVTAINAFGNTTATLSISVSPIPEAALIHYWNFNSLPTGTLTTVNADFSLLAAANTTITYPGTGAGYMDQVTPGSALNTQSDDAEGLGLRVRNPSNTRSIDVKASTLGYTDIVIKFATERTGSGASEQQYSYSIDGTNFITAGLPMATYSPPAEPNFELVTLDLSGIPGVANNPNFIFRIRFGGASASGASGNNRFDNLTIHGNSL
ncbi:Ig domain-containing protein [Flavobacterium pallidum]|uniref:Dystroglycan-type cadherin-like domain-containing protein n=1 Tax=Flavobacterium pallidum TaxID=2172098 RepID=A0A2S1SHV6_9FLAO|nr:Ig domain-containing protein [Flavobacterium pallidum]AWI25961.1 hypothetical protein HYN49_08640 [Flavobacterium pallidum]